MMEAFTRVVTTREDAHQAVSDAYMVARAMLLDGRPVRVTVGEEVDPMSAKQRRFLHGPLLGQISEQVRVDGERYTIDVWKEYLRKLFLGQNGNRYVMLKAPRFDKKLGRMVKSSRATPHAERISTESLTVKQYSEFIDRCIAHAAVEWRVEFVFDLDERDGVRYRKPVRAKRQEHGVATC